VSLTFYYLSGSPFSWRVWLALEHKAAPYELRLLRADTGDLKSETYLRLNPDLGRLCHAIEDAATDGQIGDRAVGLEPHAAGGNAVLGRTWLAVHHDLPLAAAFGNERLARTVHAEGERARAQSIVGGTFDTVGHPVPATLAGR
jgi:hypothetical protein